MFYIFQDLHVHSHGFNCSDSQLVIEQMYGDFSIPIKRVNASSKDKLSHPVEIFYDESIEVKQFQDININKDLFIEHLLTNGSRNSTRDESIGTSYRL